MLVFFFLSLRLLLCVVLGCIINMKSSKLDGFRSILVSHNERVFFKGLENGKISIELVYQTCIEKKLQ